jgi:transposase
VEYESYEKYKSESEATINRLMLLVTQFEEKVIELEAKIVELESKIKELSVTKDSRNSSRPPSSDIVNRNESLRPPSERKSGGQTGHKGHALEVSSTPDEIVKLKNQSCTGCGANLESVEQVMDSKRQVIDLPPIIPIRKEYQQYSCTCTQCGLSQKAAYPKDVNAPVQYGSVIQTLSAYFSVYQSIPYNRLQKLFAHVFNVPFSEGTIENMLNKVAKKCETAYEAIKTEISNSSVVGSDETGAKVNGKKWWIWVWQNVKATYIVPSDNRGFKTVEAFFAQGFPDSTLVSDRWGAQLKTTAKNHQFCLAHIIRELVYLEETEKHPFATNFKKLLCSVFELKAKQIANQKAGTKDDSEVIDIENKLTELLNLNVNSQRTHKTAVLQKSMTKYRDFLLPCLYDLDVPPDNNASERGIRNLKTKQKVSGQFKSGQYAFCVIRSIIDTCIKKKISIIDQLTQILAV